MIKPTFINLPEEKKKRLIAAAKKEFSSVAYNDASINKIIKDAEISRGSFYTYFDDKSDLVRCLLFEYSNTMTTQITKILNASDGDIFTLFTGLFDSTLQYTEMKNDMELFHYLFKTMMSNGELSSPMLFNGEEKRKHIDLIVGKINRTALNVKNDDELTALIEMLFMITKHSISKALSNTAMKEQARQSFLYKLNILKNGALIKDNERN